MKETGGFTMIITTTPSVEGRAIREYKGIAFGEVITGVNVIKDFGAGLRNFFGGVRDIIGTTKRKPQFPAAFAM